MAKSDSSSGVARQRRARGSLSREEILGVARQFIETDGLAELSFPRLAQLLSASATSIYSYFSTKDELVSAVVDDVTAEMYLRLPKIGDGPWDKEVVEHFVAMRSLLQRSSVYREVFAFRAQTLFQGSKMAPFVTRRVEDILALFVRAGLTPDEAVRAFNAFSSYGRAFVLVEHSQDEERDTQLLQLARFMFTDVAAGLPRVGSIDNLSHALRLGDDLYRFGLNLLVSGLRHRHPILRAGR